METKKAAAPTWETVRYMVAAIQYGGRITDDFDQHLMNTFADKFFHQVSKDCCSNTSMTKRDSEQRTFANLQCGRSKFRGAHEITLF